MEVDVGQRVAVGISISLGLARLSSSHAEGDAGVESLVELGLVDLLKVAENAVDEGAYVVESLDVIPRAKGRRLGTLDTSYHLGGTVADHVDLECERKHVRCETRLKKRLNRHRGGCGMGFELVSELKKGLQSTSSVGHSALVEREGRHCDWE